MGFFGFGLIELMSNIHDNFYIQMSQPQPTQPTQIQYKLDKLLNQCAQKEEQYISFIKEQQEKIYQIVDKYSETISSYKRDIHTFIANRQQKKIKTYEHITNPPEHVPNKYAKTQYTKLSQLQLECGIRFMYITPIIKDYLKEKPPSAFRISFNMHFPSFKQIDLVGQVDKQLQPTEYLSNLMNAYPFELYTQEKMHPQHTFNISHTHPHFQPSTILQYYHNHQLQIDLYCADSGIVYGSGKCSLQQLLYYSSQTQQWIEKIPIYNNNSNIAYLHLQLSTKTIARPATIHTHKKSQPLSLNRPNISDKESRMLQRISTYKTSQYSLIPTPSTEQSIDKNIILHRKKLQLQQIEQYKEKHKNEYMDKVIDEAMEQLKTVHIQYGQCKYLTFLYTNQQRTYQRININKSIKGKEMENVSVEVLQPESINKLIKINMLEHNLHHHTFDYTYDEAMILVATGETIMIVLKVIINKGNPLDLYSLNLWITDEYNEILHTDTMILKMVQPLPVHRFHVYCVAGASEQLSMHTPQLHPRLGKKKAIFIQVPPLKTQFKLQNQFQYYWKENTLELKIHNSQLLLSSNNGVKTQPIVFYVHVYDVNYVNRISVFQVQMLPCMKVEGIKPLHLGIVGKYELHMKSNPQYNNVLVELGCSDVHELKSQVSCQGKKQLILEPNKIYPIDVRFQTFTHAPNPQKLVIQCKDCSNEAILYRWLLSIPKQTVTYKHTYRIMCPIGNVIKFPYQLVNPDSNIQHYVLKVPTQKIIMFGGQSTKIQLQIECWEGFAKIYEEEGSQAHIVMSVDDGKTILLYLFELQMQND